MAPTQPSDQDSTDVSWRRVAIVGTGLIGGSWGLALRAAGFRGARVGVDRPDVLARAVQRGAVDEAEPDVGAALRGADLIVLAAPVAEIAALIPSLARCAESSSLVTDVGSVKAEICERAEQAFTGGALFLGGHPLAGKETSGIDAADEALFSGSTYALTPLHSADIDDARARALCAALDRFGARVRVTTAELHDCAVGFTSHLPQLLSTALASLLEERGDRTGELAGPGLLGFTRLADSPYSVWRDIFAMNRERILDALDAYVLKLEQVRKNLADPALEQEFERAHQLRKRLKYEKTGSK